MADIIGSVGKGGANAKADVLIVQGLLAKLTGRLGLPPLDIDGGYGTNSFNAIVAFQKQIVGIAAPDGRIDPGGRSWKALVAAATPAGSPTPKPSPAPAPPPKPTPAPSPTITATRLAGGDWWNANQMNYPNSRALDDLAQPFRDKAKAFIAALKAAGATVSVNATRRNRNRAWLMHYCYLVAKGQIAPGAVPKNPDCDIIWDHGDPTRSRAGAQRMVELFAIKYAPSLTSRHIEGLAVDMTIGWTGTLAIADAAGRTVEIGAPRNGADNGALHRVGKSYGMIKLLADDPHWSSDGH